MKLNATRPFPVCRALTLFAVAVTLACSAKLRAATPGQPAVEAPAAKADTKTDTSEADKAWRELRKALAPPMPPAEWRTNKPSADEQQAFRAKQREMINVAIDKAGDFYKRFPQDDRAEQARKSESDLVRIAAQLGDEKRVQQLAQLETERLKDPNLNEDERFQMRLASVRHAADAKRSEGNDAMLAEYEKGARELLKEFPKRSEPYQLLLSIASSSGADRARVIAKDIANDPNAGEVAQDARALLQKFDAVGKPFDLKFKSVDGREVDVAALKGKVVLVDFWATWCGPCVGELPHVKDAYAKLHEKGFEIVSISLDEDKEALSKFIAKEDMKWPQYFDGKGWKNEFARKFSVNSIPAMWLVDKKGLLRDLEARGDLEGKVGKLLAEP